MPEHWTAEEINAYKLLGKHPATIAKFHAGRIIQSALDAGWQPPEKYSPLKRMRIIEHLQRLSNKLHRVPNDRNLGAIAQERKP